MALHTAHHQATALPPPAPLHALAEQRSASHREGSGALRQAPQRGRVDEKQQADAAHLNQAQVRHVRRLALRHLRMAQPLP